MRRDEERCANVFAECDRCLCVRCYCEVGGHSCHLPIFACQIEIAGTPPPLTPLVISLIILFIYSHLYRLKVHKGWSNMLGS